MNRPYKWLVPYTNRDEKTKQTLPTARFNAAKFNLNDINDDDTRGQSILINSAHVFCQILDVPRDAILF